MKRLFTLLLLTLQFALLTSQDWKLSVEPIFGMKYGQVDEYVFLKKCDYDDDKLSELNWDMKSELYAGGKIDFGYKKLFSNLSLKFGIPKKTGEMVDSDWFNVEIKDKENYQYKTCRSEHDNYLDKDFSFNINVGYDFYVFKGENTKINIKPIIGFDYNSIKFKAKNGIGYYGWKNNFKDKNGYYAEWNDEENSEKTNFSGDVISYTRQTYITWLGFDSTFNFLNNVEANLGFKISPYIYAESIDTHIGRKTMFGDKTPGYFKAFNINFGVAYNFNKRNAICLNANYFYCGILRGDDYIKSVSETSYKKDSTVDGGAAEHYFDLSLSYRFKIF